MNELMEDQEKDFSDYLSFIRRRKKKMLAVSGVLMVIAVVVTFLLPAVYRSSATIMVQEQEIPRDFVRSMVSSYAAQQIRVIGERVLTNSNLLGIIHKYNLYASERHRKTTGEILKQMEHDVKLHLVNANVIDPRTGQKTKATIAFKLSYEGASPQVAQGVTNELVSLFLQENIKIRQQKASATSSFFSDEAHRLNKHISTIEARIAGFKQKHLAELPEFTSLNIQLRSQTDSEIMDDEQMISSLQNREAYLQGQLGQINPNTPIISASGQRILGPEDQLKALEARYISLSGIYAPDHPVLVRMRREIAALKKSTGSGNDAGEIAKQISVQRTELAIAEKKYGPKHPDVVRLERSIAALTASLKSENAEKAGFKKQKPDNPAYITLQAQLNGVKAQLTSDERKLAKLKEKRAAYEMRLAQSPQVQKEYDKLARNVASSQFQYQEIKKKQMDAQIAQALVKDNMGERFSLINPPRLPEKPFKPNRPVILILGCILSLGGGVAYTMLLEAMDKSVRGMKSLALLVKQPVLAVIPYIENRQDQVRKEVTRRWTYVSVFSGAILLLLIANFFWMPLDVLWYVVLRKFGR
ncbi:MAG: GumC family protein [Acidobacteriaceae bacterium]